MLFAESDWTATNVIRLIGELGILVAAMKAWQKGSQAVDKSTQNAVGIAAVTEQVGTVKTDVAAVTEQVGVVTKTTEATHILVNSNMGVALRTAASALRTVADIRGKPADKALADSAEKLLSEHEARQAVVDKAAGKENGPQS